jgi:acyl-CoA thioesterase YciA
VQSEPSPAIRVLMMPRDTNAHGTIFGGHILSLIDQAGAVAAHGTGARKVVTVAIREVDLQGAGARRRHRLVLRDDHADRPDLADRPGPRRRRGPGRARCVEVTTAELVFVHVDDEGRPIPLTSGDEAP